MVRAKVRLERLVKEMFRNIFLTFPFPSQLLSLGYRQTG